MAVSKERLHKMVKGKKHYLSASEEKKLRAKWAKSDAERKKYVDTLKYRDDRKKEYPEIGDQLGALWKIMENFEPDNDMLALVKEVKARYPKPSV